MKATKPPVLCTAIQAKQRMALVEAQTAQAVMAGVRWCFWDREETMAEVMRRPAVEEPAEIARRLLDVWEERRRDSRAYVGVRKRGMR